MAGTLQSESPTSTRPAPSLRPLSYRADWRQIPMGQGWQAGLYGLWLLDDQAAEVILVEGESDTHTLMVSWHPALGVPGATTGRPAWAELLKGKIVYAWQEPDEAGGGSSPSIGKDLPDLRVMIAPDGYKDISACHIAGFDIPALVARLKAEARPYRELAAETLSAEAAKAQKASGRPAALPSILAEFGRLCERLGLVGEDRNVKLLYLALVTRLLERPVSVVVKGPSSGGKSFTVETALKAFPLSAYYALSTMSERALAYSEEPLVHRFLVLYEAAGMTGDFASYLIRTLLSEGCIRYETVEKTADGMKPQADRASRPNRPTRHDHLGELAPRERTAHVVADRAR